MSIEACTTFLRELVTSDELKQQMKAMTDTGEMIALGKRHGYCFDVRDFLVASKALNAQGSAPGARAQARLVMYDTSVFSHYEYDLLHVPGFERVIAELNNVKIQPSTVNMDHYRESFNQDDVQFTTMSPAESGFSARYEEVMQSHWKGSPAGHDTLRRDFHLMNLDLHTEHARYEQYFQAKVRMIAHLEAFFGEEVRFSGSLWYPPLSYRLWHTNETQAGWRMYLIDFDNASVGSPETAEKSFFRYMNPQTKEIVTLEERPKLARFFKIEQEKEKLFWHCIVNATPYNRWSFGFVVPENWINRFHNPY